MVIKNWRYTEKLNKALGYAKIEQGIYVANPGKTWAKCSLVKNFKEKIETGVNCEERNGG